MIDSYIYNSSLALFNVNDIELVWINLFLQYIFYIRMYIENILNLAYAAQRAATSAEQHESNGGLDNQTNKTASAWIIQQSKCKSV